MEDSMTPNMALCLFDTDDSDSISFEEFTVSDDTDESDVDEMRTVFDNADADADGELDSVELVTFIEAVDSQNDEDDQMHGDEDEYMNDGDGFGEMFDMFVVFNNVGEIEYFGMSMDGTDMQMYVLTEDKVSAFFTGAEAGELVALPFVISSDMGDDGDDFGTDDRFMCDNGVDIRADWVNDGYDDCGDNSDENVDMGDDGDNHDNHDDDTLMNEYRYICINFVESSLLNENNTFNMTFNTASVDSTMCGELVSENSQTRDWDTGEFTMPESLTYLDCQDDPQEGFNCATGMFTSESDENASYLYDTNDDNTSESECSMSHPMNVYYNDTNMCKEFIGELMNFDSMAFELANSPEQIDGTDTDYLLVYYQYDASTGSGLLMVVENINSDDDHDSHEEMMWTFNREMTECDYDADGMVNFSELDECVSNDIANDGYGDQGLDELQQMFDMVDADEDGMLDSDEFSVFAAMTSGEPMMVCYDMNSHEIDMSITSEADCDAAGLMWTEEENGGNHDGNDNHDDNGDSDDIMFYITTGDVMVPFEGDMNDYSIVLASCEQSTSMETGELIKDCSTYMTVSMNDAMLDGSSIMFHDTDSSGTISDGDVIHVSDSGDDWDEVRLYSISVDVYSDENPMHDAPGFTGLVGMLALFGVAFIRCND
jgi:Ca2+-binding EF-hand superfamily protein